MDESSYDQGYEDGYADGFEEARTMRRQDEYDNGYADGRRSMREQQAQHCRCGLHPNDPPDEHRQHAASALRQALRDGTYTDIAWDLRLATDDDSAEAAVAIYGHRGAGERQDRGATRIDSERDLGRESGHGNRHRPNDALRHRDGPDASHAQRVGGQSHRGRLWVIPALRPWQ